MNMFSALSSRFVGGKRKCEHALLHLVQDLCANLIGTFQIILTPNPIKKVHRDMFKSNPLLV